MDRAETAAAARAAGCEVTVLEVAELPLLRVLGREVAQVFADLHRAHGVELRFGVQVAAIRTDGVQLGDGTSSRRTPWWWAWASPRTPRWPPTPD